MLIDYKTKDPNDLEAGIHHISFNYPQDEDDQNLFEVYVTKNPLFSPKSQLLSLFNFLEKKKEVLLKSTLHMDITIKFGIYNHLSNSFKFHIPNEILSLISELNLETDFEFMT